MSPEPFVTADEVAAHLKIRRRHVLQMARQNLIPSHPILFGRRRNTWRFKISEVDAAVAGFAPRSDITPQLRKGTPNIMAAGSPRSQKEQSDG
jgi:excisionase family DNA binding protein